MNVTFSGDRQAGWTDETIEVTHAISWEPDGRRLLSTVAVRNVTSSPLWVPEPLVMPFGDERKNCLRITDGSEREVRQRGIHPEFRTDDTGRQILPYVQLQPDERRDWTFDLVDAFEGLTRMNGDVDVRLTYASPSDTTSRIDREGNLEKVSCWQGTSDVSPIRLRLAAAS